MTMDEPFEILRDVELHDEPVHSWLTAPLGPVPPPAEEPSWREARRDDSWFRILP